MNGPDQNKQIEPNTDHHHGSITTANIPVTMQGDQNISSAIKKQTNIFLLNAFLRSHFQTAFSLSFAVGFGSLYSGFRIVFIVHNLFVW